MCNFTYNNNNYYNIYKHVQSSFHSSENDLITNDLLVFTFHSLCLRVTFEHLSFSKDSSPLASLKYPSTGFNHIFQFVWLRSLSSR